MSADCSDDKKRRDWSPAQSVTDDAVDLDEMTSSSAATATRPGKQHSAHFSASFLISFSYI